MEAEAAGLDDLDGRARRRSPDEDVGSDDRSRASSLTAAVKAAVGYGLRLAFTNSQTAIDLSLGGADGRRGLAEPALAELGEVLADDRLGVTRDRQLALLAQVLDLGEQRLGDRSRADADRLEALHRGQDLLDVVDRDAGRGGDLRIGLGQEAVRVERADDVVGHRMQARGQERVEVPGQVILEREAGLRAGDRVELVVLVAKAGRAVAGAGRRVSGGRRRRPSSPLRGMHSVQ